MHKNLAIYITDRHGKVECLWEFPLEPKWYTVEDEEILGAFRGGEVAWNLLTDAEEPDGWRNWPMEVRHYE